MRPSRLSLWRLLALMLAFMLAAAACGGGSDGDAETSSESGSEDSSSSEEASTDTTEKRAIETTIAGTDNDDAAEATTTTEAMADVAAPEGVLRMVEFSPVTTFDPALAQTAQSIYLYPVYDTLTRQNASFGLEPSLATAWSQPDPLKWDFTIREDVVFHDGEKLTAQVVADNLNRSKNTAGNPNGSVWAGFTEATTSGNVVTANFSSPQPQFPLEMSMVMGMMVSPAAFDTDLQRAPAGSGPWTWSDGESEAGVREVFNLNADYWNPADQGVERIEVTAVPDNTARMNAFLTGEADIMGTTRDAQVEQILAEGNEIIAVPNFFPYLNIMGRADGAVDGELLKDEKIRQAIAYAIDRDAYNEAMHAGRGDSKGGVYPSAFAEWHVPELDDSFQFDQAKARELLAEAGYPDGITIKQPIMPAINPLVEIVTQMLGAVGITVEQTQINNGELGPRMRAGEWGIGWGRELLYHPAATFGKYTAEQGPWNPFRLTDLADLDAKMAEAAAATEFADMQALYAEVNSELINRNVIVPLAHGNQTGAYAPNVKGAVLGLNMQAIMPYGVRVG